MTGFTVLAKLGPQAGVWIGLLVVAWLFRLAYLRGARHFAAGERRSRLLDELAATVRHGLPLQPVFVHAVRGAPVTERRALHRIALDLESGATLAETVSLPRRNVLPAHAIGPLRAAEGTAAMDVVLEAAARTEDRRLNVTHRVLTALLYPLGILALAYPMAWLTMSDGLVGVASSMEASPPDWWDTAFDVARAGWTAVAVLGGLVLLVLFGSAAVDALPFTPPTSGSPLRGLRSWLPYLRRVTELGSGARVLRALAALLRAGRPLHDAVRGAAPAADARRFERGFALVADRLEQGDGLEAAWKAAPLPPSVRERAVLAACGAPDEIARTFDVLADELELRHRAAAERFIARLQPAALLLVGFTVLMQSIVVFGLLASARAAVMPW